MADTPVLEIDIHVVGGEARPLDHFLTTFPLAVVVLDPYTHESSWLLDTAQRILTAFRGSDCRVAFLVTGASAEQAATYLGTLTDDILGLADPGRTLVEALELSSLPAFVVIRQDGSVLATAEGWDPEAWREATEALADLTSWSRPSIPAPGDPAAYSGTPALA